MFSWHVKKCIFHFKETGPITLQQQTWKKGTKRLCKNSWNLIKANLNYHTNVHPMDRWMDNEWHTIINMPRLFLLYIEKSFYISINFAVKKNRLLHNLPFLWSLINFIFFKFLVKGDDSKFYNDLKKNLVWWNK